jgi:hemerythrin-like domain-containing protein
MESAVKEAQAGNTTIYQTITDNALGYTALLHDHISKEDDILFPLAERVIPETMRDGILQGYQAAEDQVSADFEEYYRGVVMQYEQE